MGDFDIIDNRESVEPVEFNNDPLPAGHYLAMIIEGQVVDTQSGGKMFKFTEAILDPQYEGRRVWGQLNIINNSAKAQAIGQGQLSSLAKACGQRGIPNDSSVLLNVPHIIKVKIDPNPGYSPKNVITGFVAQGKAEDMPPPVPASGDLPKSFDDDSIPF